MPVFRDFTRQMKSQGSLVLPLIWEGLLILKGPLSQRLITMNQILIWNNFWKGFFPLLGPPSSDWKMAPRKDGGFLLKTIFERISFITVTPIVIQDDVWVIHQTRIDPPVTLWKDGENLKNYPLLIDGKINRVNGRNASGCWTI